MAADPVPPVITAAEPALPEPVLPDYNGPHVAGVVPALFGAADGWWLPAPVRAARAVVLLLLDGLGWDAVVGRPELLQVLAVMEGGPITTVVPSTTAAALTSIATGVPPAVHGVLGYRMRVGGRSLNVLRWQAGSGDGVPEPAEVQPITPFLGRRVPVVTKAEFRKTGFTVAHLRDTDFHGWKTVSSLLELLRRQVTAGAPFVYGYYDGVDKVAHEYGLTSDVYATELILADRLVDDLLDRLPADVALLVTADHGQVDVGEERAIALDEVRSLVASYSGEGRFRGLHARSGAARELLVACEEAYGDRGWVVSRDRLFDERWVGAGGSPLVRGRVGDVILAARDRVVFTDPGHQQESRMIAQHGSLTAAEMLVPLLAARGRR